MATQHEETNIAPAGNAGPVETANPAKPVAESDEKVDDTTKDLSSLGLGDKETAKGEEREEEGTVAAPSAPTVDTVQPTTGPSWPATAPDHPLSKFYDIFEDVSKSAEHNEVYGIVLTKENPFHTKLILQKFLRANQNDLDKAKQQLLETLKWRKEFDPVKATGETFDKARFGGLGYVLEVQGVPQSKNEKDVVTFNIYGAVKDKKATFGDLERYVSWGMVWLGHSLNAS
jgi:hypothetical protein